MYELIALLIKFGILLANAGIFQLAKAILRGYLHRRAKNVSVLISSFRFSHLKSKIEIPGADLADGFVSC